MGTVRAGQGEAMSDDLSNDPEFMAIATAAYRQVTRDMIGAPPVFAETITPEPEVIWERVCDTRHGSFASFWTSHKAFRTSGTHVWIEKFSGMALRPMDHPHTGSASERLSSLTGTGWISMARSAATLVTSRSLAANDTKTRCK
jgi:hypothetical protein